jgi:hypothetical protein
MTTSLARHLACIECGATFPLMKTEAEVPSRTGTAFDAVSLRRLVHERLGA